MPYLQSTKKARTILLLMMYLFSCLTGLVGSLSCNKTKMQESSAQDSVYLGRLQFTVNDNATFTNYASALKTIGWLDTLGGPGPYTIVLPDNDAYTAGYLSCCLNMGDVNSFIQAIGGTSALPPYVTYDILKGRFPFRALPLLANQELPTITGKTVYVTRYLSGGDTVTTVNGQLAISLDNPATNGLIQVLNRIPNPAIYPTLLQKIQNDTALAYFAAALQRTRLDTLLQGKGPFTVLAPCNDAFRTSPGLGANLGVNIGSPDSIMTADPTILRNIIAYHIFPDRYFLNDFFRLLTADTLSLTMLNGETMKFTNDYLNEDNFLSTPAGPGFVGNGNLKVSIPFYYPTAGIYTFPFGTAAGGFQLNYGDWPAGNGVVHTIKGLLIP